MPKCRIRIFKNAFQISASFGLQNKGWGGGRSSIASTPSSRHSVIGSNPWHPAKTLLLLVCFSKNYAGPEEVRGANVRASAINVRNVT